MGSRAGLKIKDSSKDGFKDDGSVQAEVTGWL